MRNLQISEYWLELENDGSRGLKHFVKRDKDKDTKRKLKFWKIISLEVQNYLSFDTVCIRKQTRVAKMYVHGRC